MRSMVLLYLPTIYLHDWYIYLMQMLVNIPSPWRRWACFETPFLKVGILGNTARFTQTVYIVAPPKQLEPGNTCLQQEHF